MTTIVLTTGYVHRPRDDVRCRRRDLVVTARTPVGLRGRGTRQPAYDVILTTPLLGDLGSQQR
jgi:hypothetical protein